MEKIWEFYEHLNEIVYVSDMDTYELQYMNQKALDAYGFLSLEEVKGKKCYEVLQGCSGPCAICTNEYLQPGYFHEWKYHNPVINKAYALKDTMLTDGKRRCRLEIAIDMSVQEQQKKTIREFTDNEAMINEALRVALAEPTPEESIEVLLEYLGQALKSERVYIFEEAKDHTFDNTYEWCARGVVPQKDNLQEVPYDAVELWYEAFNRNENVIIKDLELIKESDPWAYEYLKPQSVKTLVVSPLIKNSEIIGFYGVDNPPGESLNNISTLFWIMGHFIVSLLKRRNLVEKLEKLSYYDQLTGVRNRHALSEYFDSFGKEDDVGVLYCDVMGLKKVNDTQGHQAGDDLLLRACECLKKQFDGEEIFRIGGDEFLVLFKDDNKELFYEKIENLKADMTQKDAMMALGYVWEKDSKNGLDYLLAKADEKMYQDKRNYYANVGNDRRDRK